MIENEEESWREMLVNDNISDNQSLIPPTGSSMPPTGSSMPPTGSSVPPTESHEQYIKKTWTIYKSDTRLWNDEKIEELIEL